MDQMNDPNSVDGWPPSFTLDQERILNLLTGDRFYSNSSAALREAVLNAIAAVHRRRLKDTSLTPNIAVTFNRNDLTLTVSDNGEGMGRAAMTQLFARIGASAAQLESGKGSVGEFGIGVISYFMAGDSFSVQTFDEVDEPIGLKFTREMLAGGAATPLQPTRAVRGTTLEINVRDGTTFDLLLKSFPQWCRDVVGLAAILNPDGVELPQGGSHRPDAIPDLPKPDWVDRAHLSPVSEPSGWDSMSGASLISVLYRGVFVQEFTIPGLWGIEGSIDVDPKHFKPRLNREGFVEGPFQSEVQQFLRQSHPKILQAMATRLSEVLDKGDLTKWTERRWATLWLSIPRDQVYASAAQAWDSVFRKVPAFERAVGNKWEPLSLDDLLALSAPIFVAPHPDEKSTDVVHAALRLLRHTRRNVIRGLRRDPSWLRNAGNYFTTTADLITSVFARELPKLIPLVQNAEKLLEEVVPVATLYAGSSSVDLVKLSAETPPILRLPSQLIINIDHPAGKAIVDEALTANIGRWSLITITARHSYEHITQVAAAVRDSFLEQERLGLVKRRFIRGFLL
ncbi:MAG: ATP-binding protein [Candidatus Binatia bacterium]